MSQKDTYVPVFDQFQWETLRVVVCAVCNLLLFSRFHSQPSGRPLHCSKIQLIQTSRVFHSDPVTCIDQPSASKWSGYPLTRPN